MESDETVYLRFVAQNDDADLETLLIRHREGLFLFLLGFVRSAEDAEELLMDTFARLAVDKPRFVPARPGSFKSWLYAIGRNNARMHIRRRKMQTVALEEDLPSDAPLPEVSLLKGERNRELYRAMSAIKPEYRSALTLLYIEGLRHDEIAEAMGMNLRQVYNLVERGKKSLRRTLEGMGVTDARY